MFEHLYYLDWDLGVMALVGVISYFMTFASTDDHSKAMIVTATAVGVVYVVFNHVI